MTAQLNTVTVHHEAYTAGQQACQDSLSRYCAPNWRLVSLLGRDFELGFRAEYDFLTEGDVYAYYDEQVAAVAARRLNEE